MAATDGTLVLGALSGDRLAFGELYDRRARLIRAICFDATGDLHTAADLTQEVFLRAYQRLARLNDPQRFAAWAAGIARQVCRDWRRGRRREGERLDRIAAQQPTGTADELPDERLALLREAVATLPERERLALYSFYLQEMDVEQARAVVGLSRPGLYRVLARARERIRTRLAKRGVIA